METKIEIQNEKPMVIYNHVPFFSEKELSNQVEKMVKFLKTIYPFIIDKKNWNEGCIELRAVKRDAEIKTYIRSYHAWHMGPNDIKALKVFLGLLNGKGYCLYYSIYAFDYSKETHGNSKVYQKGKVNNQNALFTTILVMDFDNITIKNFEKEKQKLLDLDIETIDIFTGHGFQSIILLNHLVTDKDMLKKFTNSILKKGLKIDGAFVDPARIGRLPYSFNCKSIDKKSKYYNETSPEIFATTTITWTEKRYHIEDIFEKIKSMKDVIHQTSQKPQLNIKSFTTTAIIKTEIGEQTAKKTEVNKINKESLKQAYFMINFEELPKPIQYMFSGSRDGYRNQVILFLIPFLRNSLGLNIQTIIQAMTLWGKKSTPILDELFIATEVTRIYAYGLKSKFGNYTTDLAKEYGSYDFKKHSKQNKISIPNTIFTDFDKIKGGSIKIYLSLKLEENVKKIKEFTQNDIEEFAAISRSTFVRNIKDLVNMGYVCKKRTNRRNKEEYIYYINPFFSVVAGFTMLENRVVRLMLNELTDGEIKVYSFLSMMVGDAKNDCWASQKYISRKIGKTQQGISLITNNLLKKKYIKKITEENNGIEHCTYNVNY